MIPYFPKYPLNSSQNSNSPTPTTSISLHALSPPTPQPSLMPSKYPSTSLDSPVVSISVLGAIESLLRSWLFMCRSLVMFVSIWGWVVFAVLGDRRVERRVRKLGQLLIEAGLYGHSSCQQAVCLFSGASLNALIIPSLSSLSTYSLQQLTQKEPSSPYKARHLFPTACLTHSRQTCWQKESRKSPFCSSFRQRQNISISSAIFSFPFSPSLPQISSQILLNTAPQHSPTNFPNPPCIRPTNPQSLSFSIKLPKPTVCRYFSAISPLSFSISGFLMKGGTMLSWRASSYWPSSSRSWRRRQQGFSQLGSIRIEEDTLDRASVGRFWHCRLIAVFRWIIDHSRALNPYAPISISLKYLFIAILQHSFNNICLASSLSACFLATSSAFSSASASPFPLIDYYPCIMILQSSITAIHTFKSQLQSLCAGSSAKSTTRNRQYSSPRSASSWQQQQSINTQQPASKICAHSISSSSLYRGHKFSQNRSASPSSTQSTKRPPIQVRLFLSASSLSAILHCGSTRQFCQGALFLQKSVEDRSRIISM